MYTTSSGFHSMLHSPIFSLQAVEYDIGVLKPIQWWILGWTACVLLLYLSMVCSCVRWSSNFLSLAEPGARFIKGAY